MGWVRTRLLQVYCWWWRWMRSPVESLPGSGCNCLYDGTVDGVDVYTGTRNGQPCPVHNRHPS